MKFIFTTIIFTAVFTFMSIYVSKRFVKKLHLDKKYIFIFDIFLIAIYFGCIGFLFSRFMITPPDWLFFIFSLSMGLGFVFFVVTLIYDLILYFYRKFLKVAPISNRRDFFKKSFDKFAIFGIALYGGGGIANAMSEPELKKVKVKIDGLDKSYKIVQLSDIHISKLIKKEYLSQIVDRVNMLNPDFIAITGDLADDDFLRIRDDLAPIVNLKSKFGTFYVTGNHEYYFDVKSVVEHLSSMGVKVLDNGSELIDGRFSVVGINDLYGNNYGMFEPDVDMAYLGVDDSKPVIFLTHQPKSVELLGDKRADLILSGHTHGGQIFPFNFLVRLAQPYLSGLYKINNLSQIYVNSGTGYWGPPMRVMSSSEITYIELTPKLNS